MSVSGYSSVTITAHMSAIAFAHKANGWKNPSDSFIIKKIIEGCRRDNPNKDIRHPITYNILKQLTRVLVSLCKSHYEHMLWRAAFTNGIFQFFAAARKLSLIESYLNRMCQSKPNTQHSCSYGSDTHKPIREA